MAILLAKALFWQRCIQLMVNVTLVLTLLLQVVAIQEGINQFNENVRQIATLRLHSLNALDGEAQNDMARVEELTSKTRTLSLQLKDRIKKLETSPSQMDVQVRNNRVSCSLCLNDCHIVDALEAWASPEEFSRSNSELSTR
jgi:t-SNARE complex subunit (syntaxin)